MPLPPNLTIRHELQSGDIGMLIHLHGVLYQQESGYDLTFEAYVAQTFAEYGEIHNQGKHRFWLVESEGKMVGSIAILDHGQGVAQLRWFLVLAEFRGMGLGQYLTQQAIAYCKAQKFHKVHLSTSSHLDTAAYLYQKLGFKKTSQVNSFIWGQEISEDRYELDLSSELD